MSGENEKYDDRMFSRQDRELLAQMDAEIAWFYEHCPDPEAWMNAHGNSMGAVWDYIDETTGTTGSARSGAVRDCERCGGPLPVHARSDTRFCSGTCRQAAYRAKNRLSRVLRELRERGPADETELATRLAGRVTRMTGSASPRTRLRALREAMCEVYRSVSDLENDGQVVRVRVVGGELTLVMTPQDAGYLAEEVREVLSHRDELLRQSHGGDEG